MFAGSDIHGSTLGIIGMGRIGQGIAKRGAHGFGMKVIYHNRSRLSPELEAELLANAEVYNVVLRRDEVRQLVLSSEIPRPISETFDLREAGPWELIRDAFRSLVDPNEQIIRVIGSPVQQAGLLIEITMEATPLRHAMLDGLTIGAPPDPLVWHCRDGVEGAGSRSTPSDVILISCPPRSPRLSARRVRVLICCSVSLASGALSASPAANSSRSAPQKHCVCALHWKRAWRGGAAGVSGRAGIWHSDGKNARGGRLRAGIG